jgi:START domain
MPLSYFAIGLLALAANDGWELSTTVQGVKVYKRNIEGSPIRGVRGIGVVDAPVDVVASVLLDEKHSPDWIDGLKEAKVVRRISPNTYVEYNHAGMPVFIADRDFLTRVSIEKKEDGTLLITSASTEDELAPERKGIVRGRLSGLYILKPIENGTKTELSVELHADPKGSLPAFVVNLFQGDWARATIEGIRGQVKKGYGYPEEFSEFLSSVKANTMPSKEAATGAPGPSALP